MVAMEILAHVRSVCPVCLRVIDADKVARDGDVFLDKTCPEHGFFSTVIWRGQNPSYVDWNSPDEPNLLPYHHTVTKLGCPFDCGLCPDHSALTCTVLFEVTQRCNLGCPICFASSELNPIADISIKEVGLVFERLLESGGSCPLQLSGGEPTVRNDLPEIVALAKRMGFPHIQINTNVLRIAANKDYLLALKDAGTDLIYLQVDGVSDNVYQIIRGRSLANIKRTALENCSDVKIGVQLVPTIIRGVNDGEMGKIVTLAKEYIPIVKGVHFQPVSYFGRYSPMPSNESRMTLPDVLHELTVQTEGEVAAEHFLPRHKHDAHCGFSAFYILTEDGHLCATTHFDPALPPSNRSNKSPADHVREFIINKSRYIEEDVDECECIRSARLAKTLARAKKYSLSISGMPFMDAWTLDLERLRNCCVHVARTDGRVIPFCANYLTNSNGCHLPGMDSLQREADLHGSN